MKNIKSFAQAKQTMQAAIGVALVMLATAARAQGSGLTPPDVSTITAFILGCVAVVAAIGVATLGVRATVACYTWVRAAIK